MSDRRTPIGDLPYWPLYLGREEAARYVGVSPDVFQAEVAAGLWPQPKLRGAKGGRLTWHRPSLDAAAARDAGMDQPDASAPAAPAGLWKGRCGGQTQENRRQRRPEKAA